MKKIMLLLMAITLGFTACGGGTQYLDANKDEGSMYWGPREIKGTVKKMVHSMYSFLKDEYKRPTFIQVQRIRNKSSEHIDVALMSDEISTNLIKKRIRFIDRSHTKEMLEEMKLGMKGMVDPDSAITPGNLKSPNFYLIGNVNDNVRTVKGRRVQYIVVTLKLVQVKSMMVFWQERKEFLKSTKKNKISF